MPTKRDSDMLLISPACFSLYPLTLSHTLSIFLSLSSLVSPFPDRGLHCQSSSDGSHVCVFVWPQRVWSTAPPAALGCFALAWRAGEWTDVCVFNPFKWSGFEVLGGRFDRFSCLLFWCCYDFDRGEMKNTERGKRMQKSSHDAFPCCSDEDQTLDLLHLYFLF